MKEDEEIFTYSQQIDAMFIFVLGAATSTLIIMAIQNPGKEPQAMFDAPWSFAHLLMGLILGYMSFKIFKPGMSPKDVRIMLFLLALVPQLLWKAYEYTAGYELFIASLPNCAADLVLGAIGAYVSIYWITYSIFENPYGDGNKNA
jgi:hypothetical protein